MPPMPLGAATCGSGQRRGFHRPFSGKEAAELDKHFIAPKHFSEAVSSNRELKTKENRNETSRMSGSGQLPAFARRG